jgi:hypothetical protein
MYYTVVHIPREDTSLNLWSELRVDHGLECSGQVGHAKEHNKRFEQSFRGEECGFPFVSVSYSDVIISPSDVEFGEESAPC